MAPAAWTFGLQGCVIVETLQIDSTIQIKARRVVPEAACPSCHHCSLHVHSYYTRTLTDLPLDGRAVFLQRKVRRFRCMNAGGDRATVAESLPELTVKHAQSTQRFTQCDASGNLRS